MLIEFSVTNFLSFCETQTLSMVASGEYRELWDNTFSPDLPRLPRLLKSTVVYGPNASGKSNLIRAALFMWDFVLNSAKGQEGDPIDVKPFLLNSKNGQMPSTFEMIFVEGETRYQYGFSVSRDRVWQEWLLAYPKGRAQRWFERHYDPVQGREEWSLHKKFLPGNREVWRDATRSNALFLSTAIQLNSAPLKPVFDWFDKRLRVFRPHSEISREFSANLCKESEGRHKVLKFLNQADLDIEGISLETRRVGEMILDDIPMELRAALVKEMAGQEVTEIRFERSTADTGKPVWLPWDAESRGTQKLFALAWPWLNILGQGRILFMDEMDTSLHHNLVKFLFQMMHDPKINKNNAQLVSTTHDTALLDNSLFRRDQFWLVGRSPDRCSDLYPVSDYNLERDEPFQRRYLEGHYGGLPSIRRFESW
ncbi:MAG: ATP-binding protein [Magnetococcales bacterium]|nr:ATP-binding protein [Magnetococcales bacterium]MBF0157338.1 ATP-binding protein [Magnetococcales bacterium]